MNRRTLTGALAIFGLALAVSFPAEAAARLESRLETGRAALQTGDEAVVQFSLVNSGDRAAQVLRWHTPFLGVDDDIFEVTWNGKEVAYLGRTFKRPAPQASDYLTLRPGQSLSASVPLNSLYDMSRPGEYTVRYRAELADPFGRRAGDAATGAALVLWLEGEDLSAFATAEEAPEPDALTPGFRNCSSTRQSSLRTALNSAQTYSTNALAYLTAGTAGARYTTWFGTYSSTRYSTVRTHFSKIDSAFKTKTFTFDCGCTDSAYAYVYPSQPYIVYLCNAFWSAPNTGTDSKAGTLVHETSHFTAVASTDDWAYGQTACKSLAKSNTTKAVDNADSHEYFAENNPSQN